MYRNVLRRNAVASGLPVVTTTAEYENKADDQNQNSNHDDDAEPESNPNPESNQIMDEIINDCQFAPGMFDTIKVLLHNKAVRTRKTFKQQTLRIVQLGQLSESEQKQIKLMESQRDDFRQNYDKEKEQNEKLQYLIDELNQKYQKLTSDPDSNYLIQREKEFQRQVEQRRSEADPTVCRLKEEYNRLKSTNNILERKLELKNKEMEITKLELAQFKCGTSDVVSSDGSVDMTEEFVSGTH